MVEARVWLLPPMVTHSLHSRAGSECGEGSGSRGDEILRCAQDDRSVLTSMSAACLPGYEILRCAQDDRAGLLRMTGVGYLG